MRQLNSMNTKEEVAKQISLIMDKHAYLSGAIDIVVLDFGGQYTHLIKRILEEIEVNVEILPYNTPLEKLLDFHTKGIVLGGGPNSVYIENAPKINLNILNNRNLKILGICYGHQLIAHQLDGLVKKGDKSEYGLAELIIDDDKDLLFLGIPNKIKIWASHTDEIEELPLGGKIIAHSENCQIESFNIHNRIWGVQFHPEVSQTEYGYEIFENFAFKICKCRKIT
jgi:GMP synthase (glutamine-hydrolysing)